MDLKFHCGAKLRITDALIAVSHMVSLVLLGHALLNSQGTFPGKQAYKPGSIHTQQKSTEMWSKVMSCSPLSSLRTAIWLYSYLLYAVIRASLTPTNSQYVLSFFKVNFNKT